MTSYKTQKQTWGEKNGKSIDNNNRENEDNDNLSNESTISQNIRKNKNAKSIKFGLGEVHLGMLSHESEILTVSISDHLLWL